MPTRNASQLLPVAKAAANTGASVLTEPSISPASPGWMIWQHEAAPLRLLLGGPHVRGSFSRSSRSARWTWPSSISARSTRSLRMPRSVARSAAWR